VLTYILQAWNQQYNLAAWQGKRLTKEELLRKTAAKKIRILINAKAYILKINNRTLVRT
jgi:hypothetical protein